MTEKKKTGFEALAKASMQTQEQSLEVRKRRHTFFIGLPKEISLQENRISLTPDAVALLVNNGHDVWVETKAGIGSKFSDKAYSDAGARIVYSPQEVYQADVILKIEPPTLEEIELMHAGQTLISALQIGHLRVESLQA
ncbi:MAG TPA: alanine dehydrogenase, partial [Chryseolinea sp.]|nr:alanine dehydrogenase [Chryseolinea sp.]